MCEFIGKSNERILCKLSKSEILRLYSIVHVAVETTKTSNFACQSKSFIIIFFTCQVSAWELQLFSCHNLANDLYSETAKTVFSHLKKLNFFNSVMGYSVSLWTLSFKLLSTPNFGDHFSADDTVRKTNSIWTKMDYKICINYRVTLHALSLP